MAGTLTVLDGNTFFVSDAAGDVEPGEDANGFFHADMRQLSTWRLLLNGQPFAAVFNLVLIVPCLIFGLVFHVLLIVPSLHAIIAVHMKREDRRHREIVDAIERHGPPPGYWR